MSDPRFKTIKYGKRGRDWDMQIAVAPPSCPECGGRGYAYQCDDPDDHSVPCDCAPDLPEGTP